MPSTPNHPSTADAAESRSEIGEASQNCALDLWVAVVPCDVRNVVMKELGRPLSRVRIRICESKVEQVGLIDNSSGIIGMTGEPGPMNVVVAAPQITRPSGRLRSSREPALEPQLRSQL